MSIWAVRISYLNYLSPFRLMLGCWSVSGLPYSHIISRKWSTFLPVRYMEDFHRLGSAWLLQSRYSFFWVPAEVYNASLIQGQFNRILEIWKIVKQRHNTYKSVFYVQEINPDWTICYYLGLKLSKWKFRSRGGHREAELCLISTMISLFSWSDSNIHK